MEGIMDLMVADINRRLSDRNIRVTLTQRAKDFVIGHGYDPVYGARPLKRYLQKNVETLAAREILGGNVSEGDTITIDAGEDALYAHEMPEVE